MTKPTLHSKQRCQQRGIPEKHLSFINEHGTCRFLADGCNEIAFTRADKERVIHEARNMIQLAEKTEGCAMRVNEAFVVTVLRPTPKKRRRCSQSKRR